MDHSAGLKGVAALTFSPPFGFGSKGQPLLLFQWGTAHRSVVKNMAKSWLQGLRKGAGCHSVCSAV